MREKTVGDEVRNQMGNSLYRALQAIVRNLVSILHEIGEPLNSFEQRSDMI